MPEKKAAKPKTKTTSTATPRARTAQSKAAKTVEPAPAAADDAAVARAPKSQRAPAKPRTPRQAEPPQAPLSILMIASEAHPFARTSGLADLAGSLPDALTRLGHQVTLVLPRYAGVDVEGTVERMTLQLGNRALDVTLHERQASDRLTIVFVGEPSLFAREHMYGEPGRDYDDNAWRFGVFGRAALEYARQRGRRPSVIHVHDWQTGLVPVFQKMQFSNDPVVGGVPVVFTVHHTAFQGLFPASTLDELGLGWEVYHVDAMEYWGQISYLKGGINFSERITTVAPGGLSDILTPEGGYGFEGVLSRRSDDLKAVPSGRTKSSWDVSAREYVKVYREAVAGARAGQR
jgi:starch synthase